MLVLMRRQGESVKIGDDVVVKVTLIRGGQVHLGIEAPSQVNVRRSELEDRAR